VHTKRRVLLISSSTTYGSGYLDHADSEIRDFLGSVKRVVFVPFALHDQKSYTERARERLGKMGYEVIAIDECLTRPERLNSVDGMFIGGGNTFRLLKKLYDADLLSAIRDFVAQGKPYIGSSAGSNVAGATIKTTNDMPIVEPPSFIALGLVKFQISPHYQDPDPKSTHMGETQEERILQFLEENQTPVAGLREGSMLRVEGTSVLLKGPLAARIFRRGHPALECPAGSELSAYLEPQPAARRETS
jgi:dipeptidase E